MSFYVHLTIRPCRCFVFQTGTLQAAIRKYLGVLMLSVERDGLGRERDGLQYSTGYIRNLKGMTSILCLELLCKETCFRQVFKGP